MHLRPAADRRVSRLELVAAPRQVRLLAALTLTGRLGGRALLPWMADDNVRPKLRSLPDPAGMQCAIAVDRNLVPIYNGLCSRHCPRRQREQSRVVVGTFYWR
jgi:hypothetical protein